MIAAHGAQLLLSTSCLHRRPLVHLPTSFYSALFFPSLSSDRFGPTRSLAGRHLADTSAAVLLSIKHFPFQALNLRRPLTHSLHSLIDAAASHAAHLNGCRRLLYLIQSHYFEFKRV